MKKFSMFNSSLFIAFVLVLSQSYSQDYSRKPIASIHNYAERLLGHKIVNNKDQVDFRRGAIYYYKELNIPGNYVHVSGGYAGDYYMAMWKMDDARDLVGVTHYNCQASCIYELSFYGFTQDDSTDVSAQIFPLKKMVKHMNKMKAKVLAEKKIKDETAQFKFIMPANQDLLSVHISMDNNTIEFPLLDLEWKGMNFAIKTKYKEIPEL